MVVVVEDDRVARLTLTKLVQSVGLKVFAADCVARGMSALSFMPASILLDLGLPDGDGTAILQHIRDQKLPIKVAVVTGTADQGLLQTLNSLHPDLLIRKPIDAKLILDWLQKNEAASGPQ